MLDALLLAALLSVTDPPGDALGGGSLVAPTAALFRGREAFDIRNVAVLDRETLSVQLALERVTPTFPLVLLELYVGDPEQPGAQALLPGSQLRLPRGASWRYALRIVGKTVEVFEGRGDTFVNITEVSGAQLSASGTTLTVTTKLPVPRRLNLYGMSGSYDPFSPDGWRTLREDPSPWGFSGAAPSPVLDIIADTPALQGQALALGTLPEIRASSTQPGWLAVGGAGALLALASFAVRLSFGRRVESWSPAPQLAPLTEKEVRYRAEALRALRSGRGTLLTASNPPQPEAEPDSPEPVLN